MIHLVQLSHPQTGRRAAVVETDRLYLLYSASVYDLARQALSRNANLEEEALRQKTEETLDYDAVYQSRSEWNLLPPLDHPTEPARCLVSGTGLTHSKGAANRDAMHQAATGEAPKLTDSMQIYQWGVEGGRPAPGEIGVQPEWFYKGCGTILRAHGEPLEVPDFAEDGGEEPEVVGLYLIGEDGQPYRLGFAIGNEFSDHVMEKRNYLYLAPSKLRSCAVGPELAVGASFAEIRGTVTIRRGEETVWEHPVATGEAHMTHTLANLEYHHFKYPAHRRPGDVHIHFFGTGAFSYGAGIALQQGDIMEVAIEDFGRSLRNPIHIDRSTPQPIPVKTL